MKIAAKSVAKSAKAGKTDGIENSLIKCEVNLGVGEWISPESCKVFYIDEQAKFPQVEFEIKTEAPPPYEWSWKITWVVQACPQARKKKRFKPKIAKTFTENGSFFTNEKKWIADLSGKILGGELTVRVVAGKDVFVRKVFVFGQEPGQVIIDAYLDTLSYKDEARLAKKIFKQESKYKNFYSDEMPLVSFDNGYGLGQATTPAPTYEQVWNWKKHVDYIVGDVLKGKRSSAKKYLSQDNRSYTQDQLDMETFVYYNGANYHYYIWNDKSKVWSVNPQVLCDPSESNKGWNIQDDKNKDKTLEQLKKGEGGKPVYTGRCYAEHIKNAD